MKLRSILSLLICAIIFTISAQTKQFNTFFQPGRASGSYVPYGNNPLTEHCVEADDAEIYYELNDFRH